MMTTMRKLAYALVQWKAQTDYNMAIMAQQMMEDRVKIGQSEQLVHQMQAAMEKQFEETD